MEEERLVELASDEAKNELYKKYKYHKYYFFI